MTRLDKIRNYYIRTTHVCLFGDEASETRLVEMVRTYQEKERGAYGEGAGHGPTRQEEEMKEDQ